MTTVKFLNGAHDIEGNVVSFQTKTSRVIVDFGMVGGFKEGQVDKLIKSHLLPNLPDLFSDQKSKFEYQAIVLTQVNSENLTAAVYLNSDIKIYVSKSGLKLYLALLENDLIQPINANIEVLPEKLMVGDLCIQGYRSDCSIMGSQTLLISDGKHNYGISGNVRFNGRHKEDVYHWIRKFHKIKLDLFLFDSTAFSFSDHCQLFAIGEHTLSKQFSDLLLKRRDLIVVNTDCCNPDRLASMIKKSDYFGKKLIVEDGYVNVVRKFYPDLKLHVLKESIGEKSQQKTTSKNLEVVSLKDIKQHPTDYVLQNSFDNINFLKKLKSGLYLHSNGFPNVSENRDFEYLRDTLHQANFQYIDFSASGHASKHDLVFLTETVNAKRSVPWHSYHPELAIKAMKGLDTKFILPESNKKLRFG